MAKIHEGECGSHIGGCNLVIKALSTNYYWLTLRLDAMVMVRKCDHCWRLAPMYLQPSTPMITMHSLLPFTRWDMDILGPFPKAIRQCKFLFVTVDYFTKKVKAEAVASIDEREVCKFIWKNIDRATSAWWRCTKSRSIPQRLGEAIGLYSVKIG